MMRLVAVPEPATFTPRLSLLPRCGIYLSVFRRVDRLDNEVNVQRGTASAFTDRLRIIRSQSVASLDYITAIAGVSRLVSEAGPDDPPGPCLLIAQSSIFSHHHVRRYQPRCGDRGSKGVPANCDIHSSRFGFYPREAPISTLRLKSVALPTELPGQSLTLII